MKITKTWRTKTWREMAYVNAQTRDYCLKKIIGPLVGNDFTETTLKTAGISLKTIEGGEGRRTIEVIQNKEIKGRILLLGASVYD